MTASEKWPSQYDKCPICGKPKSKRSSKCKKCQNAIIPISNQPDDPSCKLIPLSKGQVALVDAADYEWLMQWKWFAWRNSDVGSFYAGRLSSRREGKRYLISMHSFILGIEREDSLTADHALMNTLDNRRIVDGVVNLRIATGSEQNYNQRRRRSNSTGLKGVHFSTRENLYVAQIRFDGKRRFLGYFNTKEAAHDAYCVAAKELHGEFARFE